MSLLHSGGDDQDLWVSEIKDYGALSELSVTSDLTSNSELKDYGALSELSDTLYTFPATNINCKSQSRQL